MSNLKIYIIFSSYLQQVCYEKIYPKKKKDEEEKNEEKETSRKLILVDDGTQERPQVTILPN